MDQVSLSYPCHSHPPQGNSHNQELLAAYGTYLVQSRGVSEPECQVKVARCFLSMLDAVGHRLDETSVADIQAFITEQGRYYQRKTVAAIASYLRGFLRYLAFNRLAPQDLAESVRRPCIFQGEREPRYLQDWQVRQILASMRRDSPQAKRDYALVLLLAVYGLRANEVTGLCLEDCRWRASKLIINGRKCGDALELPLTSEVAEAIISYLHVRPVTKHREVFLSVFRPYPPLRSGGLREVAVKAIRRCGFDVPRAGSHTFRYSRAQALFAAQHSLPEIASTLGHRDLRTTLGYLSFTVYPLRELALNAGEDMA